MSISTSASTSTSTFKPNHVCKHVCPHHRPQGGEDTLEGGEGGTSEAIYVNPCAMFDYMGAIFFAQWLCPNGQCYHQKVFKTITWLFLSSLQGNKPHWNSPEPSEPCLRNLHEHAPELSGTLRNLSELAPTRTLQNLPEPSGTCLWNPPKSSGTFRNLPPEPTPARTGTFRNFPEPSGTFWNRPEPFSGTCSCDPHRHTPQLISGLKTPLAYAVGEQILRLALWFHKWEETGKQFKTSTGWNVYWRNASTAVRDVKVFWPSLRRLQEDWLMVRIYKCYMLYKGSNRF